MPNPFDPNSYGMPSFEDLAVGALTESAARAKYEADELAMAEQLRRQSATPLQKYRAKNPTMQREAPGGMSVYDNGTGTYMANMQDMAARAERGQPIPEHLYQGLSVPEAVGQLGFGYGMRAMNPDGFFEPTPGPQPLPAAKEWDPVYTPPRDPEDIRMEKARLLDEAAGEYGLPAQLFEGRSALEAMQMMAEQLRQRRWSMGDESAWLMSNTADI